MAAMLRYVIDVYYYAMEDIADPRVSGFPLMSSPWLTILIIVFYNVFIQSIGPKLMKDRKPLNVKSVMVFYNFVQIVLNAFFVIEIVRLLWIPQKYSLLCAEVDYSNEPFAVKTALYSWLFFMTKLLDLLDTVFIVLRKKQKQVSFLHIYHHSAMAMGTWVAVKYVPGGYGVIFATMNTFVHFVMYTYYLITALYPQYKEKIWWKRHITELQMVQFMIAVLHGVVNLCNPYCHFPKILISIFISQNIFMVLMFWDFYRNAYLLRKPDINENEKARTTNCVNIHVKNKTE